MDQHAETAKGIDTDAAKLLLAFGFNAQAMQMAVWPMQLWLRWQAGLLKAGEQTTTEWIARRREGTDAALRALDRLAGCQDPKEVSNIQSEWVDAESKRLQSDWLALGNPALFWRETVNALQPPAPAGGPTG